jgi:hypothetical protein
MVCCRLLALTLGRETRCGTCRGTVSGLISFVDSVSFLYRIFDSQSVFLYLLLAVVLEQFLASRLPVAVAAPVVWLCFLLL